MPVPPRSLVSLLLATYVLVGLTAIGSTVAWARDQARAPTYESNALAAVMAAAIVFGSSLVAIVASIFTRSRAAKLRETAYPAAVDTATSLLVVLSLAAFVFLYAARH